MANFGYNSFEVALDGSSANSSTRTSNPIWVGDSTYLSVSVSTTQAVASVVSVDASLSDGMSMAYPALASTAAPNVDWTRYAALSGNTLVPLTVGPRWIRLIRAATDSQATVIVAFRVS